LSSLRSRVESIATRCWMHRGWLAWTLLPWSWVFGLVSGLRRGLYRVGWLHSTALPVPVIVVGNIFVGGTGKTPLTIWLVDVLRQAGYVPGVITRGYGGNHTLPRQVLADSPTREVGDEPVLIAARTQAAVVVARNRVAAAQTLLALHPEVNVIISDDGLQHYALKRDIEILLFDARAVGNGWLLPAGPLRERASRRSDFVVVNAPHLPAGLARDSIGMQLVGEHAYRLADPTQSQALTSLQLLPELRFSKRIVAVAGIGNPARFFTMLRDAGLHFVALALPDHADFSDHPFADIKADIILMTEKDAVKARQIEALRHDLRLWVVPVTARIGSELSENIVKRLQAIRTSPP